MQRPPTLKVVEVFLSTQGEGLRQGEPTIFIRLAGCNLRCSFCDTKYAWRRGEELSPSQILDRAQAIRRRFRASWVCLTGGEPFLQDISALVARLKREGFLVQVETNGTIFRPVRADWITLSPKPKRYLYKKEYRARAKEVKLVVTKDLAFQTLRRLRKEFPLRTPLILQPQSNKPWSIKKGFKLLWQASAAGYQNVRFSFQAHKLLGLP